MSKRKLSPNLDTSLADVEMFLVKVPEYVEKRWTQMIHDSMNCTDSGDEKAGASLGTVYFQKDDTAELELSQSATNSGKVPKRYKMKSKDMTIPQAFVVMHKEDQFVVKGRMKTLFPAAPSAGSSGSLLDPRYSEITGAREKAANKPKCITQMSDVADIGSFSYGKRKHVTEAQEKQKKNSLTQSEFQERRGELEADLFRRFEQMPTWTMANLMKATGLAAMYLKDLLSGMAILNKAGPLKNQWTLQKDFVHNPDSMAE